MSIPTPPSTTLSEPPSPTEVDVSHLDLDEEATEKRRSSSHGITKTITTTVQPIFMRPKPIYVVVATSLNPPMGIGHKGKLPWPPIKADMAFFKNVTSQIPEASSASTGTRPLNAVVMGRKTWESIPPRFRPLAGRLNVIITRSDSQDVGKKILQELKSSGKGTDNANVWEMHPLAFPKAKAESKSKRSSSGSSTILVPSGKSTKAKEATVSPIVISPSLPATLSLLSSPAPIRVHPKSAGTKEAPDTNPALEDASLSLQINKIYCIGGAEIYRQILALSSQPSLTPTTPSGAGTGSETGTDTEGEAQFDKYRRGDGGEVGDHFDVRILQTQIRKTVKNNTTTTGPAQGTDRRMSKVEVDFDCDTFFPDLLPSPGSGVKSATWRHIPRSKLVEWVEPTELPQHHGRRKQSVENALDRAAEVAEEDQDETHMWLKDEKAGVDIRVIGWERR